ncbi:dihydrolipoyl dehydrogenase [Desulfobotulus sp. H1]|uniref:Dihydrolipoyl dehydrogenase n=1 Tax=Desulfobotulus pelophilus TaxID=2823377 RepID=A0ABT3NAE3_9BACT|nr:dihydrolipoyl dehydrogenase [Desulfobotulus pelophilus]MCW7754431.1 dihydrolipoyl dehydrogenase [Desulfobotulus pelophilus]
MTMRVTVIGAGPGGYMAAIRAAELGAEVCLVEKEALGGTCLNWGCIPSKVMVTAARIMRQINQAKTFGIHLDNPPRMDMAVLQQKQQTVIATQQKGIESLIRHHKIHYGKGLGRITGPGQLTITSKEGEDRNVEWDRLILAPGTRPAELPFLPFDGVHCLSSNDFLRTKTLPSSAIILGAGVVGCEFASILSGLGSRVTLVEMADRILPIPGLDASASKLLAREFKKNKTVIHTGKRVVSMEKNHAGIRVQLETVRNSPAEPEFLEASCLIVCVGRSPQTENLGLEKLGIQTDAEGYLPVNDGMETEADGVYAIGDCTGPEKIMLAHVASMEGRVAAERAMGMKSTMRYDAVPSAVFTDPELAFVGLTADRARALGYNVNTTGVLFRSLGKAHAADSLAGEAVLISEAASGRILGCHMVGCHTTELIAEMTLAVNKRLTLKDLAETIHAHPTLSEICSEAARKGLGMAVHG